MDDLFVWKKLMLARARELLKLTTDEHVRRDRAIKKLLKHINAPDFNIHLAMLIHSIETSMDIQTDIHLEK